MRDRTKNTILYLDDEPACLEVFALMFGDDYEVRTAATIEEARRALDGRPFDVIVSDQVMPGISGTAFLREVALTHPESRRILLTGHAFAGALIVELTSGVIHGFVTKPWVREDIGCALERVGMCVTPSRV